MPKWHKIYNTLSNELCRNIKKYIERLDKCFGGIVKNTIPNFVQFNDPMIQKYVKNEGKYEYHNDTYCDYHNKRNRILTYIFYLNDVIEGGETEFLFGKYKIKPTAGKLLLFPASWTYPHCGKMPYSNDKYIITGWIYTNDHPNVIKYIENNKNNIMNK